jgi:predicted amidohydrolase
MKVKIAVVQFEINQYKPDYNLMRAEKFIAQAADSKADIIVFPEDFITGPIQLRLEEFADNSQKYCKHF